MDLQDSISTKTMCVTFEATKVTADLLQAALKDICSGKVKSQGKTTFCKLAQGSNLESIEITENNIKDFMTTAAKYDVKYALKRDRTTSPPTYYVFFETKDTENFKRAFSEYAFKSRQLHVMREQVDRVAQQVTRDNPIDHSREKTKQQQQTR